MEEPEGVQCHGCCLHPDAGGVCTVVTSTQAPTALYVLVPWTSLELLRGGPPLPNFRMWANPTPSPRSGGVWRSRRWQRSGTCVAYPSPRTPPNSSEARK